MKTQLLLSAGVMLTLAVGALQTRAATIVDVDATTLGLADGITVNTLSNSGSAGDFAHADGIAPVTLGHPANSNPGVQIQGVDFTAGNMNAAMSAASVGLVGNQNYTVRAWVWNPAIGNEEAVVSWGRRGGGLGTNAGFHQGTHNTFGAIGHWGGGAGPTEPDVSWGNGGADISATLGRWAQLSWVYDGLTDFVYIDGVLSNQEEHPGLLNVWDVYDDGVTQANVVIGSESEPNGTGTPIAFSGTIARVQVFDTAMTDQEILAAYNAEAPLFVDGITNVADTDGDGIVDEIEDMHACMDKTVPDADGDPDTDGLLNIEEIQNGTDPCNPDSDDDNVNDGDEVNRMAGGQPAATNPLVADTDGDGLTDDVETDTGINNGPGDTGTDPLVADVDNDGLEDGVEISEGTNPFEADSDGDGWDDGLEIQLGSDPTDPLSAPTFDQSTIVDVDATNLDVEDGTTVGTLENLGTAGQFTTLIGFVETASHPSNNDPNVLIQGLAFDGDKMTAENSGPSVGMVGNQSYTVRAWVWNPDFGTEEAIVSWGHRGGPLGSNAGFHQGDHPTFGAIGHWGGGALGDPNEPDVGWANDSTDILPTAGRWAQLSYVYDGLTDRVFIDGEFNNLEEHPNLLDVHDTYNDGSETLIAIGSESDAESVNNTPIPFSGTIARVQVFDIALSDQQVLDAFNAEAPLFFDGISPISGDPLNLKVVSVGNDLVFTWKSQPGKLYNLRTDLDLEPGDPEQWSILGLHQDILATPPLNTLTIPRPADPERYFAVGEFPAPPVFAFFDDLENGIGDWAMGSDGDPGSEWELGAPNFVGPPAAFSGANCFGTVIGAFYSTGANDWLQSPSIDLTTAAIATLSFRAFRDIDDGFDFGKVAILDASNGTEIAVLQADITGLSNGWVQVSYPLPAVALGKMIKIEFRFTSDLVGEFAGWYLDDIAVTTP